MVRGQLHFHACPMVPYMEIDKDEGGSCKRFTDLPRIRYGDPGTGLQMKKMTQNGLLTVFFNLQTLSVSIHSRSG